MDEPTQQRLPFDAVTIEAVTPPLPPARSEPTEEAVAAFERLETWLCGPRGPVTELAEDTLRAVEKSLIEGKYGWFHVAEDGLEVLKLRNGKTEGDDIPAGASADGRDFQQAVEDMLDAMPERMLPKGRSV